MGSSGVESALLRKQSWYAHVLARMDQKARVPGGLSKVKELGECLRMGWSRSLEQQAIIDELGRMAREGGYEATLIRYLRQLQFKFERCSWYMVLLDRMDTYARSERSMQDLIEIGEDLKCSEMQERERGRIVCELDRMLEVESGGYAENATEYLRILRQQIAGT